MTTDELERMTGFLQALENLCDRYGVELIPEEGDSFMVNMLSDTSSIVIEYNPRFGSFIINTKDSSAGEG